LKIARTIAAAPLPRKHCRGVSGEAGGKRSLASRQFALARKGFVKNYFTLCPDDDTKALHRHNAWQPSGTFFWS
jgi:hypothetical protein